MYIVTGTTTVTMTPILNTAVESWVAPAAPTPEDQLTRDRSTVVEDQQIEENLQNPVHYREVEDSPVDEYIG